MVAVMAEVEGGDDGGCGGEGGGREVFLGGRLPETRRVPPRRPGKREGVAGLQEL